MVIIIFAMVNLTTHHLFKEHFFVNIEIRFSQEDGRNYHLYNVSLQMLCGKILDQKENAGHLEIWKAFFNNASWPGTLVLSPTLQPRVSLGFGLNILGKQELQG